MSKRAGPFGRNSGRVAERARERDTTEIDQAIEQALTDQGRAAAELSAGFGQFVPGFLSVGA